MHYRLTLIAALLALAACGAEEAPPVSNDQKDDPHAGHAMLPPEGGPAEVLDTTSAVIEEIDVIGRQVMLRHGPLENIGMGAMTMFFGVGGDVDLKTFAQGAEVQVEVKRGRDGSYRVMRMCSGGPDCLEPRELNDR